MGNKKCTVDFSLSSFHCTCVYVYTINIAPTVVHTCVTERARVDHVRDWCERDLLIVCDCFAIRLLA